MGSEKRCRATSIKRHQVADVGCGELHQACDFIQTLFLGQHPLTGLICLGLGVWISMQIGSQGARSALWRGWIIGMVLCPVWMIKWISFISIDPRLVSSGVGVAGLLMKGDRLIKKIAITDILILMMFATVMIADKINGDFTPGLFLRFVRRWIMPYIVGRVFFSSQEEVKKIVPFFAKCLLILAIYAVIEAVTKVNIVNKMMGKSFYILDYTSEGFRWGLKRAMGNNDHPIYFGMSLTLIFPWAVEAAMRAWHKKGPRWWLLVPPAIVAAVVVTVSRGAMIACFFSGCVIVFFRNPKWRITLLLVAIIGGGTAIQCKKIIMDVLSKAAEGDVDGPKTYVWINGEEYEYSGTKHRELLFVAYEPGIENAGWFGYGTSLRTVDVYEDARLRFSSIDCHYLMWYLQYGKLGLGLFILMLIMSIYYSGRLAIDVDQPRAQLCAGICGSLVGVGMLMMSVFFAAAYGSVWVFTVGLTACLYHLPKHTETENGEAVAIEMVETKPVERALVPGHAPVVAK